MNDKDVTSLNIALTGQAKKNLSKVTESFGMTQKAVTERVIQWFATQPKNMQSVILGHVEGAAAYILLSQVADSVSSNELELLLKTFEMELKHRNAMKKNAIQVAKDVAIAARAPRIAHNQEETAAADMIDEAENNPSDRGRRSKTRRQNPGAA